MISAKNKEILTTELQLAKYSGMTAQQAFNDLTNKNIVAKQRIDTRDIQKYLALKDKLLVVETSTTTAAKKAVRMMELFDCFSMDESNVETALTAVLDALIVDNLIDATDKAAILAMGEKLISRAEQLGINNLRLGYVESSLI